jgi:hypothetical protein
VLAFAGFAAAVGFLTAAPSEAAPEARNWSHRITSLTGQYVNHWTVDDPEPCGLVGEGTVTVTFRMTVAPRVLLVYSRFAGAEPSGYGRWIVGVPSAHGPGLTDGPRRPATGTITLVDNTVQQPPRPDDECEPPQKSGCGTRSLGRTTVSFSGYNRRFLRAELAGTFRPGRGGCGLGRTEQFNDRFLTGGTREGELLLRMPSVATVNRRRVLIVTGTTRKQTSSTDCEPRGTCSDDVTRRVTATFKKL